MTTSTDFNINYSYTPSKKDIIKRLFEAQQITFDEMWVLILGNEIPTSIVNPNDTFYPQLSL